MNYPDVGFNMVRTDCANFPLHNLPAGYRLRTYQPGDEVTWLTIQRAAEPFITMPDDYFDRQYGDALDALPDRMFFVESVTGEEASEAVGTISAWWEKERHNPNERGRIHWVAIHPAHQRRGLAKPMLTHAMQRLAQSHPAAMLGTSSGRPWAVKVYLDFGFRPDTIEFANPQITQAWHNVQGILHHPVLKEALG